MLMLNNQVPCYLMLSFSLSKSVVLLACKCNNGKAMDANIFAKVYHVNISMLIGSKFITGPKKLGDSFSVTIYTQADAPVTIQYMLLISTHPDVLSAAAAFLEAVLPSYANWKQ